MGWERSSTPETNDLDARIETAASDRRQLEQAGHERFSLHLPSTGFDSVTIVEDGPRDRVYLDEPPSATGRRGSPAAVSLSEKAL